jgi:hypothetical protein
MMGMESSTHRYSRVPAALLLLALFALMAWTGWPQIMAPNIELGDFAANSLLIQDAKSLHLIYGNYSRVGFNHPGPAILYVLAAGELVLHDWLHLVPSPLSGQLLAVCLYNAAWITVVFALMRRIAGSGAAAMVFLAVFLLAVALCDWRIFDGLWFPHLYFFPFAALLVAMSRLLYGRTDMLVALAVASGFLINGHVSFVAIIAIMLMAMALANHLLARRHPEVPRIAAKAWWREHRRALLLCGGIVLLFLVPFVIANLLDRPTPVQQYLRFGRGNKGNTPLQALAYVGVYWGQGAAMVSGLALAVLGYFGSAALGGRATQLGKSLSAVFVAATIAVLYYAKAGVDMLDQTYIALFYYNVPSMVAGAAVLYCYLAWPWRAKGAVATLLVLACAGGVYHKIKTPPEYIAHYNQPQVKDAYQALAKLRPAQGRIVLDLDNADNYGPAWGNLWVHVLGIEAYAKRRHDDLFCFNENWHISFTKPARCRPEELGTAARYRVFSSGPRDQAVAPVYSAMGISLHRYTPPGMLGHGTLTVKGDAARFDRSLLASGWSGMGGEDFVWSEGVEAVLALRAAPADSGVLTLDLMAFLPKPDSRQQLTVYVNGQPVGSHSFTQADNRKQVAVPYGPRASEELTITLKIATPMSPKAYGLSQDDRQLGVALYGYKS